MKFYKRLIQPRYAVEIRRWFEEIRTEKDGMISFEYKPKMAYMGSNELEGIKEWFHEDQEPKLREMYENLCERRDQKLVFAEKYVLADEDIPIEIVRCKDCEHWKLNYYDEVETCFEHRNIDGTEQATRPDDFCSWGKRRTNGT